MAECVCRRRRLINEIINQPTTTRLTHFLANTSQRLIAFATAMEAVFDWVGFRVMFTILDWEVGRYTIIKIGESCERYSIASCLSHVDTFLCHCQWH